MKASLLLVLSLILPRAAAAADCALPKISHGTAHLPTGPRSLPIAYVICDSGYAVSDLSAKPRCENGTWSEDFPTCEGIACDKPRSIANADWTSTNDGHFPSTLTYSCNEGYAAQGPKSFSCDQYGHWDGIASMACAAAPKAAASCPELDAPEGGTMRAQTVQGPDGKPAQGVVFSCDPPTQVHGSNTLICSKGRWSGPVPTCRLGEPPPCREAPPAIAHGSYTPATGPWPIFQKVQYACDTGYAPYGGGMTKTCLVNNIHHPARGRERIALGGNAPVGWSSEALAACVDAKCPAPPGVDSGSFAPAQPPKGQWLLGDAVTYSCGSGYHLGGQAKSTCQHGASGNSWTTGPSCLPQIFADRSMTIQVGQTAYEPLNYPPSLACNGPTPVDSSLATGSGGNASTMGILGLKVGKTTVQVVCGGVVADSIPLTVVAPTLAGVYGLDSPLAMSDGEYQWGANCSNGVVSAESSDPKILWIGFKSNNPGGTGVNFQAQTIAQGTVTVTFKCSGYVVGTKQITVQ